MQLHFSTTDENQNNQLTFSTNDNQLIFIKDEPPDYDERYSSNEKSPATNKSIEKLPPVNSKLYSLLTNNMQLGVPIIKKEFKEDKPEAVNDPGRFETPKILVKSEAGTWMLCDEREFVPQPPKTTTNREDEFILPHEDPEIPSTTLRSLLLAPRENRKILPLEPKILRPTAPVSEASFRKSDVQTNRPKRMCTENKQNTNGPSRPNPVEVIPDDGLPPFDTARVDAKQHRPRHYNLMSLEIGNFKVDSIPLLGKNRLKVIFSQKQFTYEFFIGSDDHAAAKNMACIHVDFESITAMEFCDCKMRIIVNKCPVSYIGAPVARPGTGIIEKTNVYDKSTIVDVTGGELALCPLHTLTLGKYQGEKLKVYLWCFHKRFQVLTSRVISETDSSRCQLPLEIGSQSLPVKSVVMQVENSNVVKNPNMPPKAKKIKTICCKCESSCRSAFCDCLKQGKRCNSSGMKCALNDCDNPYNILHSNGIDVMDAALDGCLKQNILNIKDLNLRLMEKIFLKCCSLYLPMYLCIPGVVSCPNDKCKEKIAYSWCRNVVVKEDITPRNHCPYCCFCHVLDTKNCKYCKKCFKSETKSACPTCSLQVPFLIKKEADLA